MCSTIFMECSIDFCAVYVHSLIVSISFLLILLTSASVGLVRVATINSFGQSFYYPRTMTLSLIAFVIEFFTAVVTVIFATTSILILQPLMIRFMYRTHTHPWLSFLWLLLRRLSCLWVLSP
jgi:hypothetical protein